MAGLRTLEANHPELAPMLRQAYAQMIARRDRGEFTVSVVSVARALGSNRGEAYVVLKLLEKEGLVHERYNIYNVRLGRLVSTADSLGELDRLDRNEFHGSQHELAVEIAFRLTTLPLREKGATP